MTSVLQARFLRQLERAPERRCIGFLSAGGAVAWRTRDEVHGRALAVASRLAAHGLARGDVCVLALQSREYAATALLGTLLLGALPLLVAPPVIQGRNSSLGGILVGILRRTRARMLVCDPSLRELEGELRRARSGTRFLFGEEALAGGDSVPPVVPGEDDVAALQLTSGTTGFPRICVWKQRKVVAALDAMMAAMRLHPDRDICFNWTPLYHDMGLVNNFFLCLANGVPLVMQTPQDFVKRPVSWLRGLHATGATTTWSPNFGFAITARSARDADLEGVRLDHVRAFWNAAERIHLETILAFRDRFASYGVRPEALKTNFGCAENVGGATFSDPDGPFVCEWVDRAALYDRHVAVPMAPPAAEVIPVVSAGRAAPGLELYVVSRTGKPLPEGRVGEVALRTPSRLEGYLGDRRATRRAQLRDLLRTGDLGYLRRGELFWVGRVRERINVFGKKLDPSDFEAVLLKVDGLREGCFAAFGVDDGERGTQRLVVVSEVRDEIGREPEELIEEVRDRVAKDLGVDVSEVLLVPRGSLTKTSSGKRRHRHFRQLYLEGKLQEQRLQLQSV